MKYPGFCGGSDTRWSANVNDERTVNLYPELQTANAKSRIALFACPCASIFARLPDSPVRAIFFQDGRCFTVAGEMFAEVFRNGTYNDQGRVALDQNPVTISTNGTAGHQLFIVSAGLGYIFDLLANTLNPITDANFPTRATMGTFIDGYFIVLKEDSITFQISSLEDGISWDGLDVGQVSESSNKIRSMIASHRELWLFGSKTTEVWANSGNASFPFQPLSGTFIEQGCIAPYSPVNLDNSILWLGGDTQGSGVVYRADGYTPKRVSTPSVELALQSYPQLDDTIGWSYQQNGHLFYVLYIPTADTSWVYDATMPPELAWHERAIWSIDYMRWLPYRGRCHAFAFNQHLIGDRSSGTLYELRTDIFQDDWATAS